MSKGGRFSVPNLLSVQRRLQLDTRPKLSFTVPVNARTPD